MDDGLRLWLSFAVGGIWVAAVTAVAERRGSRLGGWIGGLPSTLAVALLFVALAGGADRAGQAADVVPLSFAVNALFLLVFTAVSPRGFRQGMSAALAVWAILQSALAFWGAPSLWVSALVWALVFGGAAASFRWVFRVEPHPPVSAGAGMAGLLGRALAGGGLVLAAVVGSLRLGPAVGGVLASVPAVFLSSLFFANRCHGLIFARSLGRSLLFSAIVYCPVFAIAFRLALSRAAPLRAFAMAYALTLLLAIPLYRFQSTR